MYRGRWHMAAGRYRLHLLEDPVAQVGGRGGLDDAGVGELDQVLARASAAGVELLPLSICDVGPPSRPGIVLGYGAIATDRIDEGLRRLRRSFDRR
jgi:GntR family transcriptional regulator/MocR family aminotransferase